MKRIFVLILILLLACGCQKVQTPLQLYTAPAKIAVPNLVSDNGVYKLDGLGVLHIILLFPGGEYLDPHGKEGAIRLLCASMVSGGIKNLGPDKTEELLDGLAANISIYPDKDFTYATISLLEEDADEGIKLLLETVPKKLITN